MAGDKLSSDPASPLSPRAVRRRDDSDRFVKRFSELTGMQALSASIEGLPRQFLAREVPAPTQLIEQYGPRLEARTYNALCRFEPGRGNQPWTFGRLLEIRGFGIFSLIDLLEAMGTPKGAANSHLT